MFGFGLVEPLVVGGVQQNEPKPGPKGIWFWYTPIERALAKSKIILVIAFYYPFKYNAPPLL
jgi:hypothetical protein